jgi:methylase of polypeptide subunit release factors
VLPLIAGPPGLFQRLRGFLKDSNYFEAAVCERLGLKASEDFLTLSPNVPSPRFIRDGLDFLARLFLIGEFVDQSDLESWVPGPVVESMTGLGLIAPSPRQPEKWYATAALYPAYGLHIVSDRWSSPEAAPIGAAADVVYPALTVNTVHFMGTLPTEPCERLLDLCSGTGVAAFWAARYAGHVWSADITESSAHCAEFNRRLNGIENATVVMGDLYEPVDGQMFDRISAHPPYRPSLQRVEVYADGGELGDEVTRRIVAGLPKHLRPGGRLYCTCAGPDRVGEGFETRVRSWLGTDESDFDVFLFERQLFDPIYIANQQAAKTRGGFEQVEEWNRLFERCQLESLVYGTVLIQRKAAAGRPATVRRRKGTRLGTTEIEWLRIWETAATGDAIFGRILDSRPVATQELVLQVTHRIRDGALAPQEFRLETTNPFTVECPIQPWAAYLLARCDGKSTARELLGWLKENGFLAAGEPEQEFADFLGVLISGGLLEIEGFRLPKP